MLTSLASRSSELKSLILDLDQSGGADPNGLFPLFFIKVADILAPKLAVVFRLLVRQGSFPECWRIANVTALPKGSTPTTSPSEYRPISITPVLSKVFERLLAKRLFGYADHTMVLPDTQFGFRKGLGTCDALLFFSHDLQDALDHGFESRAVALDFSSAFDSVNHAGLLFKLKSMGVGGSFFNIIENFLTGRQQRVCVDGCYSPLTIVRSGVPQGSVLGPLLFILFTADMWLGLDNKLVSYADDSTLYACVRSPDLRSAVAESLNNDLFKIQSWCRLWGMTLNPKKSNSILVSRSRTLFPPHPDLYINDQVIAQTDSLKLLGVLFDSKLTFESHLRSIASSIAQKVGIMRKCRVIYDSDLILKKCFFSFILPYFEYCAPVWLSAAESHLKLLDRSFNMVKFLLPDLTINLSHRRIVGALSVFFKIINKDSHPFHFKLPQPAMPVRSTRQSSNQNSRCLSVLRHSTDQFKRSFLPVCVDRWNRLPEDIVSAPNVDVFKSSLNKFLILTDQF